MALRPLVDVSLARRLFGTAPVRTLALVRAAWPRAVGPDLARRTEVVALEAATLRVRVPDARWRKELHRMQPDILARLREIVGDLAPRRLGFVEGEVAPAPSREAGRAGSPTPPAAPPEVVAGASVLRDVDLRRRFLEVAARYLERSKGGTHA
jgi:predicted nucleic acid-binding Zn ribbon protein